MSKRRRREASSPTGFSDDDQDFPEDEDRKSGRRKINIEYIDDKNRRNITFSKRKAGIMKKVSDERRLIFSSPKCPFLWILTL